MELRQLHLFLGVASSGSLLKASEELNISQPALGQQIKNLEADLGVALFHRHSRGVTLTEAGQAFLPQARNVLSAATAAAASVGTGDHQHKRSLLMGASLSLCARLVPEFLDEIDKTGDLHIDVKLGYANDLYRLISEGKIDFAILGDHRAIDYLKVRSLPFVRLARMRIVLIGAPDLIQDFNDSISLADALNLPLLVDAIDCPEYLLIAELGNATGHKPNITHRVEPFPTRRELLRQGKAFVITVMGGYQQDIEAGDLDYRIIHDLPFEPIAYLVSSVGLEAEVLGSIRSTLEPMIQNLCAIPASGLVPLEPA